MEIYSLPLRVVIAMWVIQRIKIVGNTRKEYITTINVIQHLDGQIAVMDKVLRVENSLREKKWFENIFRDIVHKYRSKAIKERDWMKDVGVSEVVFIKKGE